MATKNYMINDKWLDLDKQNIVELQSVDGVLDTLKVNGSEIVTPSGKITITENGTDIDIAQYATADVNVEGGGSSWQTVYEGSVATESEADFASGDIVGLESLDGDSVKVTFNGVEYILPKHELGYGEMGNGNIPDFSNYPLFIETSDTPYLLYTETAGTYTLKIEEPGGGSSDFSTAEVTIINNTNDEMYIYVAILQADPDTSYGCVYLDVEDQATVTVVLYKGEALTNIPFYGIGTSTNGNYDDGVITGDDTITITPAP